MTLSEKSHHAPRADRRKGQSVLIEQPDPRHFGSRRLGGEHRLAFFPDPDPPRLGHFPDSLLDRLKLLLARLLDAALVGPALAPLGAALFGVARLTSASRAFAKASCGAAVLSLVCSAGFEGCGSDCTGCTAATLLAGFSCGRRSIGGERCRLCLRLGLLLRLRRWLRRLLGGRGSGFRRSHMRHRLRWCRRDGYRLRRHPAFQLGHCLHRRVGNVRSQIAAAKTSADRHDHGSHACKISRRYPHGSAPLSTRATRGMGRCSGTAL